MSLFIVDYHDENTTAKSLIVEATDKKSACKEATRVLNTMGLHKRDIFNIIDCWKASMEEIIGD